MNMESSQPAGCRSLGFCGACIVKLNDLESERCGCSGLFEQLAMWSWRGFGVLFLLHFGMGNFPLSQMYRPRDSCELKSVET